MGYDAGFHAFKSSLLLKHESVDCAQETLSATFQEAGFTDVKVERRIIDVNASKPVLSATGQRKVGLMYYSATKPSRQ